MSSSGPSDTFGPFAPRGWVLRDGATSSSRPSLETSALNFDQQSAFRFHGRSIDEWLGPDVTAETRKLVDPLIYREGDFLFLADLESVRAQIGGGPALQHLVKRLLAQSTVQVTLDLDEGTDVDGLVQYWGRGGRATDIRPILESAADSGPSHTVDIAYLLPDAARLLLYRYQKLGLGDLEPTPTIGA